MKASFAFRPDPELGPGCAHVEVNGHDITDAVRTVDLRFEAGEVPHVELDLGLVEVTDFASPEVQLYLSGDVHEALVKMGWTPPPEDT